MSTRTKRSRRPGLPGAAAVLLLALAPGTAGPADLDEALSLRTAGNAASAASQARIDQASQETDRLAAEYRTVLDEIDSLRAYNQQLSRLLASQESEMASLRRDIANATSIGRQVTPLMLQMVEALEAFVELDVPFRPDERRRRVENLEQMMDRADVTDAEKYRAILEAYQIENDYGRSLGTYRGELDIEDEPMTVEFLHLGRVALVYMTLDRREAGFWDQKQRRWVTLPSEYKTSIQKGLRMARKQVAPDLVRLPIPAAEDAP